MKKLIIFTVIALFGFTNVNAQDINFGAKAGVNFASITGDDVDDLESRTSLHIGIVTEFVISDTFSFQPELLYSTQGATDSGDGWEETLKLDYINLPLMAKYYVSEGFSLEAGPQIGFLLNAEWDWEEDGDSGSEDIKDEVKGIDFGVNLGVGYKMESGLNFGARYNLGLSDINDIDEGDFDEGDFSIKNSVIQVSIGYFF